MEKTIEKVQNINQKTITNYYIYALIIVAFLFLTFSMSYILIQLSSDKIYSNIRIMNINVGGHTIEQAKNKISKQYSNKENEKIVFKVGDKQNELFFKDINVIHYPDDAVEDAYKLGREGNFLRRIKNIINISINGQIVQMPINYNKDKVIKQIDKMQEENYIEPIDDWYEIKNNMLIFNFGSPGRGINKQESLKQLEIALKEGIGTKINLSIENIEPKEIDIKLFSKEAKDATYKVKSNREIEFIPEKYGVIIDKQKLSQLISKNRPTKESFSMEAEIITPKITLETLKSNIFRDEIGKHETYFGTSSSNRKENVKLSASKIGELILAPGDEFSYNDIVGPRTPEHGFKMASVYINGTIAEGYGGGICQTSSTLYNAILRANLDIVERQNHMFEVGYVPTGFDATVSYGSIDFRFKNNRNWPVKIVNETNSSNVIFRILGTKELDEATVEYRREIVKAIPFQVEKEFDSNKYVGEKEVIQNGHNGYTVNVYKIVKKNGEVVSNELMNRDTYRVLNEKVIIGTKPVMSEETDNSVQDFDDETTIPVIEEDRESYFIH